MLIYHTTSPFFIHENEVKAVQTKMFKDFGGLQTEIERWTDKIAIKKPDAELVIVFYLATNVNEDGKPCYVSGSDTKLILFARFTFVDVSLEPIYLIDEMTDIEMNGSLYKKVSCHLGTDASFKLTYWLEGFQIITDQILIDDLEWNKIT